MKIGVIGGGASGLITAWLIENEHEVMIFEKQNFLGGHALTVPVTANGVTTQINCGFEFFNDFLFPHLSRLLHLLQVKVTEYEFSTTFIENDGTTIVLPPLKEGKMLWNMMTYSNIVKFIQLGYLQNKIGQLLKKNDLHTSVEEFIEGLYLTPAFKREFFYPYIAAGWGAPLEIFKKFIASDVFSWFISTLARTKSPIWKEIDGGVCTYIEALTKELRKTEIKLQTTVESIKFGNDKYELTINSGESMEFDGIVMATNAEDALKIIQKIPQHTPLQTTLKTIDYFPAKIAVHADPSFMPSERKHWSISNVRQEGPRYSFLTIYKPWQGDIFRSWLCPEDDKLPSSLYSLMEFRHVIPNAAYFSAQKTIEQLQGAHQLWLAGNYTSGLDSHESSVKSAINIGKKLAPNSDKLAHLLGGPSKPQCPYLKALG